ncbi:hypothetical protein M422DRAFT_785536, partial [Sphaerobolus stellatus SS14]
LLTTIRSRSDDATSRAHQLAQSVLAELDKLSPLVSALTTKTSSKLRETSTSLRTILASSEPITDKLPKVRTTISEGVKDVVEDIVHNVHELVEEIRSVSSSKNVSPLSTPTTENAPSHEEKEKPAAE